MALEGFIPVKNPCGCSDPEIIAGGLELMTYPKPGSPFVIIDLVFAFPGKGNAEGRLQGPRSALPIEVEIFLQGQGQGQIANPAVSLYLLSTQPVWHFTFRIDDKGQLGG